MRLEGLLVAAVTCAALSGCSEPATVAYQRPGQKEKAARAAFVDSHPNLPPVVKRQLLAFETTPEVALRRVEYVRAHPDLAPIVRQQILTGSVRLQMTKEQVRAAWGEPESVEVKGVFERWVYPSFSQSGPARSVEIFFRDGEVVTVRN